MTVAVNSSFAITFMLALDSSTTIKSMSSNYGMTHGTLNTSICMKPTKKRLSLKLLDTITGKTSELMIEKLKEPLETCLFLDQLLHGLVPTQNSAHSKLTLEPSLLTALSKQCSILIKHMASTMPEFGSVPLVTQNYKEFGIDDLSVAGLS